MRLKALIILFAASLAPRSPGADTTSFAEMLSQVQKDPHISQIMRLLDRDLIGDITDDKGEVTRLRLESWRIMNGEIFFMRTYPNGTWVQGDAPVYLQKIPSDAQIRKCRTVMELQALLGHGIPGFDGSIAGDAFYGGHSWVCFGPSGGGLVYLRVLAETVSTGKEREKGVNLLRKIQIGRGNLRPATPGSSEEKRLYLSGKELFESEEQAKAKERERYPQPLRDLVKINEDPGDSDLSRLSQAVQGIRDDPAPKLFSQLVQHMDVLIIRERLEDILFNRLKLLKVKPWDKQKEAIAVKACLDAMPLAKENERETLVAFVLEMCGGGKIEIQEVHGGRSIDVYPYLKGTGYTYSYGGATSPLPLESVQKELQALYSRARAK